MNLYKHCAIYYNKSGFYLCYFFSVGCTFEFHKTYITKVLLLSLLLLVYPSEWLFLILLYLFGPDSSGSMEGQALESSRRCGL